MPLATLPVPAGAAPGGVTGGVECKQMIVFELICPEDHRFEGWFASAEAYARQEAGGLLSCPVCASSGIRKLPSAKVRTVASVEAKAPGDGSAPPQPAQDKAKEVTVASFLEHILANTEDVGRSFPEEARKIHYEEAPRRPIRGVATREEARELTDEGIPVVSFPMPSRGDVH